MCDGTARFPASACEPTHLSGKKTFVLSYRITGRKRLGVLGRYGADLTLDQARTKAAKFRTTNRDGIDPFDEQRKRGQGFYLC